MAKSTRRGGRRRGPPGPPPELPEYLKRLGVAPRKPIGQHFLIDEFVLGDIAEACRFQPGETAFEIGAGPGGLTEELVERAERVVAVELDEELAAITRRRLEDHANLVVLAADILDFQPIELLEEAEAGPPYVAVGNLPYYITQPVVRRLLESDPAPERLVVMVQREVARRMVGGPGKESLLSSSIKMYGEPRQLFDVPASAFWPPPKVQSAVVAIERRDEPAVELPARERPVFFELLRAGFAAPRKQLHNALPGALGLSDAAVTKTMEDAGLDPAARAQHLDLEDWERLYHSIQQRHPGVMSVR
jgi:16S rRNA (adenine1518-N6/adenine1519-N6)-dimethyltransferase